MMIKIYVFLIFSIISFHLSYCQTLDISEQLINSTIKIQTTEKKIENGKLYNYRASGTGFFFEYVINGKQIHVIVTNKHVIKDAEDGSLLFTLRDINGNPIYGKNEKITFKDFKAKWILHPDTGIDLAILPIAPIIKEYASKGITLSYIAIPENFIPNDSIKNTLSAIEDVYMIGYPFGLKDEFNNLPIVRKGITATPYYLNYESNPKFLVDIPIYFGSSGSPIIIYNSTSYNDRIGNTFFGRRFLFLGINYATYTRNFEEKLITKIFYGYN